MAVMESCLQYQTLSSRWPHVDCSLTTTSSPTNSSSISESTTGNADSAAACTDKPDGTAGNAELLESFTGTAAASCNPNRWPCWNHCYQKQAWYFQLPHVDYSLTCSEDTSCNAAALLLALTSLMALLVMSSSSST